MQFRQSRIHSPVALTSTSTMLPAAQGAMPGGGTDTNLGSTLKKYRPSTLFKKKYLFIKLESLCRVVKLIYISTASITIESSNVLVNVKVYIPMYY